MSTASATGCWAFRKSYIVWKISQRNWPFQKRVIFSLRYKNDFMYLYAHNFTQKMFKREKKNYWVWRYILVCRSQKPAVVFLCVWCLRAAVSVPCWWHPQQSDILSLDDVHKQKWWRSLNQGALIWDDALFFLLPWFFPSMPCLWDFMKAFSTCTQTWVLLLDACCNYGSGKLPLVVMKCCLKKEKTQPTWCGCARGRVTACHPTSSKCVLA